jgi:hypothetical protein
MPPPPEPAAPSEPYEPDAAPPPPPPPAPTYALYQGSGPPAQAFAPEPSPTAAPGAAPAPAAVAVLERDPVEFPGQPLPPDFFHALPERARRAPRKLNRTVLIVAIAVGAGIVSTVGGWYDREDAIASPARHLVAGACTEYRDIADRLENDDNDFEAMQDSIVWFQNNRDRFVEAAVLDPELQAAADVVVWFDDGIDAGFQQFLGISSAELEEREEPLSQACFTGPGRA